jgi:hypothetical protein
MGFSYEEEYELGLRNVKIEWKDSLIDYKALPFIGLC